MKKVIIFIFVLFCVFVVCSCKMEQAIDRASERIDDINFMEFYGTWESPDKTLTFITSGGGKYEYTDTSGKVTGKAVMSENHTLTMSNVPGSPFTYNFTNIFDTLTLTDKNGNINEYIRKKTKN